MSVILFQPRFEPLILAGTKTTTIRPPRRDGRPRARLGETVSLRVWSGLPYRTPQREVARAEVVAVFPVRVWRGGIERLDLPEGDRSLDRKWCARRDGFANWRGARAAVRGGYGGVAASPLSPWGDPFQTFLSLPRNGLFRHFADVGHFNHVTHCN